MIFFEPVLWICVSESNPINKPTPIAMNPFSNPFSHKTIASILAVVMLSCSASTPQANSPEVVASLISAPPVVSPEPEVSDTKIQVALLLDTSGSMDGLIDQAKAKLWKIINELALARHDNKLPNLEIALYEYGKSSIPAEEGFLRQLVPLTNDLDKVSEALFALRTGGGEEYCGMVIKRATSELEWSESNDDLKLIFIAGNESFSQGPENYQKACSKAISNGIVVNTIFCGNPTEGINTFWKSGAELADGQFLHIDHNQQVAEVTTPFDTTMIRLNTQLNGTYVVYGASGDRYFSNAMDQDANAYGYSSGLAAERAATKASANYKTYQWDLVSATSADSTVLEEMDAEELPEPMQELDADERKEFLVEKQEEREAIQNEIKVMNKKREDFLRAQEATGNAPTLDAALLGAIREQAVSKNFQFVTDTISIP